MFIIYSANLFYATDLSACLLINFENVTTRSSLMIAPPPAEASEIVQQGALDYSEFSQGVG